MKFLFVLILTLFLFACTSSKQTYWCGDHACINNKEKKAYFEKTLITEIRDLTKQKRKKSDFEIIKEKAGLDLDKEKEEEFEDKIEVLSTEEQKALAKQLRLEEKQRIKEEKKLTKQSRLDEKKIGNEAKAEGDCTKLVKLHEKLKCMMGKKKANKAKSKKNDSKINLGANVTNEKNIDSSVEFSELTKKIHKKNLSRSYPDINDIPN